MGNISSRDKSYTTIDKHVFQGELHIQITSAVIKKDLEVFGKMDPYVRIHFGLQIKETEVCQDGGQFPEWKHEPFEFKRTDGEDLVMFQVLNKQLLSRDDFIGEGALSLCEVKNGDGQKKEKVIQLFGKGMNIGEVKIIYSFLLDPYSKEHPEVLALNQKGILHIMPKQGYLARNVLLVGDMDPFLLFRLGDKTFSTSVDMDSHLNPRWSDLVTFEREIHHDICIVECQQYNDSGKNDVIGVGYFSLTKALLQQKQQKSINLFYEGILAGSIELDYIFEAEQRKILQDQTKADLNGYKTYVYQNGDQYTGFYQDGKRVINGKCIYIDSRIYDGQWDNDEWSGVGQLLIGQSSYDGSFLKGKRHGNGTQVFSNGKKYTGQFADDKYEGEGKIIFQDGSCKSGYFINGYFVGNSNQQFTEQQTLKSDNDNNTILNIENNFGAKPSSIKQGEYLNTGDYLQSENQKYCLKVGSDGNIQVFDKILQAQFYETKLDWYKRQITPPFKLGVTIISSTSAAIQLKDYYGVIYSSSFVNGMAPFYIKIRDDGKYGLFDNTNQCKWLPY